MPPHDEHDQATRLERVETIVETLSKSFTQFRDETRRDIEKIAGAVSSHGKTSWPLVVSIIMLGIAIVGLGVMFVNMRTEPIEATGKREIEHVEDTGRREIEHVDKTLDRHDLELFGVRERVRELEGNTFRRAEGEELRDRIATLEGMLDGLRRPTQ